MILKSKMNVQELNKKVSDQAFSDKNFDVDNVYEITERLAFPRLVGSEGEKKAIKVVSE